jgi:hypothetical protein
MVVVSSPMTDVLTSPMTDGNGRAHVVGKHNLRRRMCMQPWWGLNLCSSRQSSTGSLGSAVHGSWLGLDDRDVQWCDWQCRGA